MEKEAAVITTTVTAFLVALLGFLAAFGLDVSEDQKDAIVKMVIPTAGIILVIGPVIRQFVFSKRSTLTLVDKAYEVDPKTGVPPVVN